MTLPTLTTSCRTPLGAALLAVVLALAGCGGSATGPLPRAGAPDALDFSLGRFGVDSRIVELRGDTVVLRRVAWNPQPGQAPDTMRVVPTDDAWRAFWTAAERTGLRAWQRRYEADGVVDGTGWALRVADDGRVIESSGNNAYPDRLGREHEIEMTEDFRAFVAALGELVGAEIL